MDLFHDWQYNSTEEELMKIAIGSDHAGFQWKQYILEALARRGHDMTDCGTYDENSVDYPDYAREVCSLITGGEVEYGIVICGTGIGISIAEIGRAHV